MNRRDFIALSSATVLFTGCDREKLESVAISKSPKRILKLATSWPSKFPIIGTGVEYFAKKVKEMSDETLEIEIHSKGSLVPPLEVFDAVSSGLIDGFHSGPYYWKGKNSAMSLIGGFPLSFTSIEMNGWMSFGGGLELWREIYKKYNLYPLLGGNTDIQMGGWFKQEINSLNDLNGLKMRVAGLGGDVMARLGVTPILLPASEIYLAMERGVIDALEWVGVALDIKMGFHKIAKYYYSGWQEPASNLETTFNLDVWNSLSKSHQEIIRVASENMNTRMIFEFNYENSKNLSKLKDAGVIIKSYPKDVLIKAKEVLFEIAKEESSKNSDFKTVWDSAYEFLNLAKEYSKISAQNYLNIRN